MDNEGNIYLFRGEFTLTNEEKNWNSGYLHLPWIQAPRLDLESFKNMYDHRQVYEKIRCIAINKICNHLW